MKIGGLQNLTLLDYPDKTACIVFTNGCNLRCPYCHNASLVTRTDEYPLAEEAQVFSLLKKRRAYSTAWLSRAENRFYSRG